MQLTIRCRHSLLYKLFKRKKGRLKRDLSDDKRKEDKNMIKHSNFRF